MREVEDVQEQDAEITEEAALKVLEAASVVFAAYAKAEKWIVRFFWTIWLGLTGFFVGAWLTGLTVSDKVQETIWIVMFVLVLGRAFAFSWTVQAGHMLTRAVVQLEQVSRSEDSFDWVDELHVELAELNLRVRHADLAQIAQGNLINDLEMRVHELAKSQMIAKVAEVERAVAAKDTGAGTNKPQQQLKDKRQNPGY